MSSSILSSPPTFARKTSYVPGQFEPEEMQHEEEDEYSSIMDENAQHDVDDESINTSSFFPGPQDPSSLVESQTQHDNSGVELPNNTVLEEREMRNRLMDVESSFLPELSHLAAGQHGQDVGVDDTYMFGVPNNNLAVRKRQNPIETATLLRGSNDINEKENQSQSGTTTPPETYKTPAPEQQQYRRSEPQDVTPEVANTSALELMSSDSAVARTVSRVQSMATMGGYETAAEDSELPESPSKKPVVSHEEDDATPKKKAKALPDVYGESSEFTYPQNSKRPRYLNSRSSQARLSYDSTISSNTDASDATLGADFALQSGGALADNRSSRQAKMGLSRQASLGSMMSGLSDDEGRSTKIANPPDLTTLEEESPRWARGGQMTPTGPITPMASTNKLTMPTDTIIANNVRDLEVPGTFARQYRQERSLSPSKSLSMAGMTPGPKRGLTLKEHRSTVEKLGKENFDLKMKIHFLDQALQRRSEDGIKELITENVQLKSDRLRLEKDNHLLRKQNRDLQKKLEESGARESPNADQGYGTDDERSPTADEEVIYLRERVETTEVEIEKLRAENIAKETEKRRLAEMVRSLGDTRAGSSDVGSREERDMWKDMLEAETIAREQSEEDNKRLHNEITKLRQETFGTGRGSRKGRIGGSLISRASSEDTHAQHAELGRLRHEVSELQKTISAQASALTSRNREKERLYQEIEDMKIGRMGGARSSAGDSILDRSASRARSHSRASNGTRMSRLSDPERDNLENKINELRDEVSQLKLDNQGIQSEFDQAVAELDAVDQQAQADADQANEELALLAQERDNALRDAEEQDHAFQQLKNEAQEEIDGLGDELDAKIEESDRLQQDLQTQSENVKALQAEMRSAAEGLVRLEDDAQSNLARYQNVKAELEDSNRELENMEKNLNEAESKMQRLTVQQESSHNEIAFLREEQDADKIKIGDLESLMQKVHLNLQSERDKASALERRLEDERQQRDTVSSKKEREVQKIINDLNREASGSKEELRTVRKALSTREVETNTFRERLGEVENGLRHIIGDPHANRQALLSAVTKMQRELHETSVDLDATRRRLDERETLLGNRDQLLENNGLEYRKLVDALEKERQTHRQDKHSFEQSLKSHQQAARSLTANGSRINELEQARISDRKKLSQLESQYKDQLAERNQVLLTIWKKLSAMCGPDWAHNNSLINGNLPSQEVIGNMLFWPGFHRNVLLAARQVEGTLATFRDKIKRVERDLWKEYQALEHTLELRTKKLERIEHSWEQMKLKQAEYEAVPHTHSHSRPGTSKSATPQQMSKLQGENRLLKAELQLLQQQQQHSLSRSNRHFRGESRASVLSGATSNDGQSVYTSMDGAVNGNTVPGLPPRSSSMRGKRGGLERHHTTNIVEHLANVGSQDMYSLRSNSTSSRSSGQQAQPGERGRGLMIPAGPFNAPSNGNFAAPPSQHGPPREPAPHPPGTTGSAASSEVGSTMTSVSTSGPGQEKWIHRLRELERRLKQEREQRLLDRSGMRKRLEEREAVNEELRLELERERIGRHSLEEPAELDGGMDADEEDTPRRVR